MIVDPELSSSVWDIPRVGPVAIRVLDDEACVRFAADELARYLPALVPEAELEILLGPPDRILAAGIPLVTPPDEQAILVEGDGRRYAVSGGSPPAVLHAAYALMELLGARWLRPGPMGEMVRPMVGQPPPLSLCSAPAFHRRGLADACLSWWPTAAPFEDWLVEALAMVDWMGKMRMNRLFVHFNRLPPGDLSPLLPELEKRGIALELGGHNLPKLLTPDSRELDPLLNRLHDGRRRSNGNFCVCHPPTSRLLAEGARRYVETLPPAHLYHLWPADAKDDPWCSCAACGDLSTDQQMWRAVTAAAEGVAIARPNAAVAGLLYHESLGAAGLRPDGAEMVYAPRERCYLHSIDGPCPRNRRYAAQLRTASGDRNARISLLEYYGDPVLLGRPANIPSLVAEDLAAYRAAGVRSISTVVFGTLSWWLYPLQLYAYARGCWDPTEAGMAAEEYCGAAAGASAEELLRYHRLTAEAARTHFRFCGYGLDGSWATLPFPPTVPEMDALEHREGMEQGSALLREAGSLLRRILEMEGTGGALTVAAAAAHSLEEAFHRATIGEIGRALGDAGADGRAAFALAVEAMERTPSRVRGVFGNHWMLQWLQRCRELGREAPL